MNLFEGTNESKLIEKIEGDHNYRKTIYKLSYKFAWIELRRILERFN